MDPPSAQTQNQHTHTPFTCRYSIHIVDMDPASASAGGWLEDTSLVDKYRMNDEEYNKRENTYRWVGVRLGRVRVGKYC